MEDTNGGNLEHIDDINVFDSLGGHFNSILNSIEEFKKIKKEADLNSSGEWREIRDNILDKILKSDFLNLIPIDSSYKQRILPIIWELFPSRDSIIFKLLGHKLIVDGLTDEGLVVPLKSYSKYDPNTAYRVEDEFTKIIEFMVTCLIISRCFSKLYPSSFKLEKKNGDNISKGKANKRLLFPESIYNNEQYGFFERALAYSVFRRKDSSISLFSTGVDLSGINEYKLIIDNTLNIYKDYYRQIDDDNRVSKELKMKLQNIRYQDIIFEDYCRLNYIISFDDILTTESITNYCSVINLDWKRHVMLHRAIFLLISLCPLGLNRFMLKSIIDNSQFWNTVFRGANLEDQEKYLLDIIYYLHKIIFRVLPALETVIDEYVELLEDNEIELILDSSLKMIRLPSTFINIDTMKNIEFNGLKQLDKFLYPNDKKESLLQDMIQLKSLSWLIYKNTTLDDYYEIPGRLMPGEVLCNTVKYISDLPVQSNVILQEIVFSIIKAIAIADYRKHKLKDEFSMYSEQQKKEAWSNVEKLLNQEIIDTLDRNCIYNYYKERFYIRDYDSARISIDSVNNFIYIWRNLINSEITRYRDTKNQSCKLHELNCDKVKWDEMININADDLKKRYKKSLQNLLKDISNSHDRLKYEHALTCNNDGRWILSNWKNRDVLNSYTNELYLLVEEILDYLWLSNYEDDKHKLIAWERYWSYHNNFTI